MIRSPAECSGKSNGSGVRGFTRTGIAAVASSTGRRQGAFAWTSALAADVDRISCELPAIAHRDIDRLAGSGLWRADRAYATFGPGHLKGGCRQVGKLDSDRDPLQSFLPPEFEARIRQPVLMTVCQLGNTSA
jgi:hypothetical protein